MVSNNAIRQAHPSDYDHVISVANEWWDRDVSVGLPRLFLEHFWTTSLIAEDADGLAGFLIGFHSPGEPETA